MRTGDGKPPQFDLPEDIDAEDGFDPTILSPWDYTLYCIDVWCMHRSYPDRCSLSDKYEREYYIGGVPKLIDVVRRGCICKKTKFIEEMLEAGPDSAGWDDAAELAAELMRLRQTRLKGGAE
jgi:hypothetical protein